MQQESELMSEPARLEERDSRSEANGRGPRAPAADNDRER
jgi:hypothetical protein